MLDPIDDTVMTQTRKRGRNMQEDEVEFMPLSKRINNLHINPGMMMNGAPRTATSSPPVEWGPGPPCYAPPIYPDSPPDSVQSLDWNQVPQYSPDLTETQNPHYFNINKLLFDMYLQRLQRGCHV